jgi:hypothetical protein
MASTELLVPDALKAGIYEDVPAHVYHALDAASNSRLARLVPPYTPAHLRAYLEEPPKQTDAMVLGSAIHTCTFEPHLFEAGYMVAGTCAATTKSGSPCSNGGKLHLAGGWYCGVKGHAPEAASDPVDLGISVLSDDAWHKCQRTAEAVRAHPKIGKLLGLPGRAEVTVVWVDQETGLLCKGRIDWLVETSSGWVALDLKTTTDASPRGFERTIADRGYHRQLPMYADGLAANEIELRHLVFAAAEKEPPFAVAGYRLEDGAADEGRIEYRALLRQYAELVQKPRDEWPGFDTDIIPLALPAWAYGRITERTQA